METTRIIGGIAFAAAFFAAGSFAIWLIQAIIRKQHGSEAAALSGAENDRLQHLFRNGIRILLPLAALILKVSFIRRFLARIREALEGRNILSFDTALTSLLLGGAIAVFIVASIISGSWVFALTCIFLCLILINAWANKQQDLYRERLREELPGALQAMNSCFCIGYSLPQIFDQVTLDLEGPLKSVFQRSASVINAGGTVEEALEVLKEQTDEPELFFLATALEIQHRTGSSLSQVLEVVRQSIDDQLELKRLLRTQTAQAKLSAQIVTVVPFLIIGVFSLVSEGFLEPFFTSTMGIILLGIAITMQAIGIMLVRNLLRVEVV